MIFEFSEIIYKLIISILAKELGIIFSRIYFEKFSLFNSYLSKLLLFFT